MAAVRIASYPAPIWRASGRSVKGNQKNEWRCAVHMKPTSQNRLDASTADGYAIRMLLAAAKVAFGIVAWLLGLLALGIVFDAVSPHPYEPGKDGHDRRNLR